MMENVIVLLKKPSSCLQHLTPLQGVKSHQSAGDMSNPESSMQFIVERDGSI